MGEHRFEYRLGPRPMDVAAKLPSGWVRLANNQRLSTQAVEEWSVLAVGDDRDLKVAKELVELRDLNEQQKGRFHEQVEGLTHENEQLRAELVELRRLTDEATTELERRFATQRDDQAGYFRKGYDDALAKVIEAGAGYLADTETWHTLKEAVEQIERGSYNRGFDRGLAEGSKLFEKSAPARKLTPDEMRSMLLAEFGKAYLTMGTGRGLTMRAAATAAGLIGRPEYTTRYGSDLLQRDWIESIDKQGHSQILRVTHRGVAELRRSGVEQFKEAM